jgi:radical SAM protein with 4Fe4S-binding SPASM domain
VLGLEAPGEDLSTHCGVGANILYVMSDGEVGYCPTMTPATDGQWRLGNVLETSIADIWRGGEVFGAEDMQCANVAKCTYGSVCRGGCRSNAFTATGDPTACDTEMRQGFDALVVLTKESSAAPVYKLV